MQYANVGRSGLEVSRIGLGLESFYVWRLIQESDAFDLMHRSLELGVNLFNVGEGECEELVGRWLKENPSRRGNLVLATSIGSSYIPTDFPNQKGHSARYIRKAIEKSLARLGTDHVDICQLDHIQRSVPWEEIWQAMDKLVKDGSVIYVGSANYAGWHIVQANEAARRMNCFGIISHQIVYNLFQREAEMEVLPACEAYGVGVFTWSTLYGGVLCGRSKDGAGRRARKDMQSFAERHSEKLSAFEGLCRELGVPEVIVAVSWVLKNSAITAGLVGPRTLEQLEEVAKAPDYHLPSDVGERLNSIFPGIGAGGAAPEAFAW